MSWSVQPPLDAAIWITDKGQVRWNDAAHLMLRRPTYVDLLTSENKLGLREHGSRTVGVNDELMYQIEASDELSELGWKPDDTYSATPQLDYEMEDVPSNIIWIEVEL